MSKTAFGKAMTERGFDRFRDKEKVYDEYGQDTGKWKDVRYYLGLSFK